MRPVARESPGPTSPGLSLRSRSQFALSYGVAHGGHSLSRAGETSSMETPVGLASSKTTADPLPPPGPPVDSRGMSVSAATSPPAYPPILASVSTAHASANRVDFLPDDTRFVMEILHSRMRSPAKPANVMMRLLSQRLCGPSVRIGSPLDLEGIMRRSP